ncbi:MAG: DNA polymerase I [Deltaproteobacteria bacterium GWA2_54_12]|nr:MAG: DNA polymerase I [Deltaproteobacteria bacterium GWA2_54_12]
MAKELKKSFFIIDGSSVMYRAFHAVPASFTTSKGMPTNAVYGFTQTLRKILNDFKPEYVAIAFDVKGPSFRHKLMAEYKAERPPMPDLLSVQVPFIKKMVAAFNIPAVEMPAFEADDVIATLVKKCGGEGLKIAIITGDKDMYQLVDEDTVILDYLTGKEYRPPDVKEKYGVEPTQIRDLLALAGDSSDGIPGVPGIGVKTAAKLLAEYESLEGIYSNIENITKPKLKESLKVSRDTAFLSRELATLHPDVPVECGLEGLRYTGPDFHELERLLNELEFRKLIKEMVPEAPGPVEVEGADFQAVLDEEALSSLSLELSSAREAGVALVLEGEGFSASLKGLAIALNENTARHIVTIGNLSEKTVIDTLAPFLKDETKIKHTDNSKALYLWAGKFGIEVRGVGLDISLASYLINPSRPEHTVGFLGYDLLGISPEEVRDGADIRVETVAECKKATIIMKLRKILEKELEEYGLSGLYTEMELPLAKVLAGMEAFGIRVDRDKLSTLSREIEVELVSMESQIYAAAGMEFNINSPKQLSELLFEKLGLKPVKKTKTGYSTDEEVLTQLAQAHDVPRLIIGFRQLSKLKSTYVDAILALIDPSTGRIHTSFNQTVTATGRLSSSRPNLQNIPIRGEAAGRIREAFVADAGFTFLSADYSQIELRIMAHMSGDPILIDSFQKDEDIHERTAAEVFGVMPGLVTSEMRRRAKAINFGIIYGMGPWGLSTELGISMKEASEYINRYFDRYRLVKEFMDSTVAEAAVRGSTRTLFGRRRFIPELKSPVESTQRLGARLAINTPIQGSAADMIKAAMIKLWGRLGGMRSRMLLQIHDELIFEAAVEELQELKEMVKTEMEGVIVLKVPVKVNIEIGPDLNSVE